MNFNNFPHIQCLTHTYPDFSDFFNDDPYCTLKDQVECVLQEASRLKVSGYEKIASDTKRNPDKVQYILSEIIAANLFANLGASVKILKDEEFKRTRLDRKNNVYTPDLLISFKNGLEVLADVTQSSSALIDEHKYLSELIEEHHIPFEIQPIIGASENLLMHEFDGCAKAKREKLFKEVIDKAITSLMSRSNPNQSGIVIVRDIDTIPEIYFSEDQNFQNASQFHNFLLSFEFDPTHDGNGYANGCIYSAHLYDGKKPKEVLLKRLSDKANRRSDLPDKYHSHPFLVIYHVCEYIINSTVTSSALTGNRTQYMEKYSEEITHQRNLKSKLSLPIEIRNAIDEAYTNGWKPTLDHWDYGLDSTMGLSDRGVYLNSLVDPTLEWAQELSGVLILRGYNLYNVQWLPNPFSKNAEPRLQDIGLPLDKLGISKGVSIDRDGTAT